MKTHHKQILEKHRSKRTANGVLVYLTTNALELSCGMFFLAVHFYGYSASDELTRLAEFLTWSYAACATTLYAFSILSLLITIGMASGFSSEKGGKSYNAVKVLLSCIRKKNVFEFLYRRTGDMCVFAFVCGTAVHEMYISATFVFVGVLTVRFLLVVAEGCAMGHLEHITVQEAMKLEPDLFPVGSTDD